MEEDDEVGLEVKFDCDDEKQSRAGDVVEERLRSGEEVGRKRGDFGRLGKSSGKWKDALEFLRSTAR